MPHCPLGEHCPECNSHRRNSPGTFITPNGHEYCRNDWHTHTFDGQTWQEKAAKSLEIPEDDTDE